MYLDDMIICVMPVTMYLFRGDHSLLQTFSMYFYIIIFGGFIYSIIAINAGHHHPEVVHDGDPIR